MSEVLKAMKERRSIRSFKADMVPQEIPDQIIEAGLYSTANLLQIENIQIVWMFQTKIDRFR